MRPKELPRLDHCLNCGERATGNFCSQCGQENEDRNVALKLLLQDMLVELASFDSKLLRTLAALLFRPGLLTNEFNAGRRVRYLSPFKIYLLASVVFFLVLSWDAANATARNSLRPPEIRLEEPPKAPRAPGEAEGESGPRITVQGRSIDLREIPATAADYERQQQAATGDRRHPPLVRTVVRQALKLREDPGAYLRALLDTSPKLMFVLLPLFALLLKIAYFTSKRLYVEHLVFSLHCHAFVFSLLALVSLSPNGTAIFLALATTTIYLVAAMRRVYGQSLIKTLIKFVLLAGVYQLLLLLALVVAAAFTFVTL